MTASAKKNTILAVAIALFVLGYGILFVAEGPQGFYNMLFAPVFNMLGVCVSIIGHAFATLF